MSEVDLLKKQLAVLQEKMDRKEEDRFISSFAAVESRKKKRSNKAKRKKKPHIEKNGEKSSKLSDEQTIGSDTSELCK